MAQVGEFHVSLIGDVSRFSKPMQDATKQAETFSKSVNFTTAATDFHTAATGRAAAANTTFAGASAFAAQANFGLATAAGTAAGPVSKLRNSMAAVTEEAAASAKKFAETTSQMTQMQRTANRASENNKQLERSLRSVSAQADLMSGRIGLMGYVVRLNSRPFTEWEVALRHTAGTAGGVFSKVMLGAADTAINFNRAVDNLGQRFIAVSMGVMNGAGSLRHWLVNLQPATTAVGKLRLQTDAFTKYLKGTFGPVLSDIGAVGRFAWSAFSLGLRPIAPLISNVSARTVAWAQGLFSVTKNGAGLRSFPAMISNLGAAFYKLGEWFPRWQKGFDKIGLQIQLFAGSTIGSLNKFKQPIASAFAAIRGFGDRIGTVFATIGGVASKGLQAITAGFQRVMPYISSFASGVGYVARETTKGVATVIRMGGALAVGTGYLAKWTAKLAIGAAQVGIFGLSLIKNNGFLGQLVAKAGLAAAAMGGIPFAGLASQALTLVSAVPLVSKAFSFLGTVIGGVSKAVSLLAGKLAIIGTLGAGALLGVGGALALLTKNGFSAGSAAAQLADKVGITTESLIGLQHAGKQAGVKDIGSQIKGLNDTLQGAQEDSPLGRSLAAAGLSLEQLRAQSPDQALGSIADAMRNMGSHAERVRLATQLFGEEGARMAVVLKDGSAGLQAASEDAKKLGLSLTRVDAAMIEQANIAVGRLKDLFLGVGRQIAIRVAPFVEAAANRMTQFGTQGAGAASIVDTGFQFVGRAITFVLDAVDWTINSFIGLKQSALEFTASATSGLASFMAAAEPISSWIDYGIQKFGELGIASVRMFAGTIDSMGKLASLLPSMPEWLGGGKLIDPAVFDRAANQVRGIADSLKESLDNRSTFTFKGVTAGLNSISGGLQRMADDTGKALEERLAGPSLSKRFGDLVGSVTADARARAEETARLAAEGSAGILQAAADKAEEKTRQLKDAAGGDNRAFIKGTAENFALNLQSQSQAAAQSTSVAPKTKVVRDMEVARAEVNRKSQADSEAPKHTEQFNAMISHLERIALAVTQSSLTITEAPAI